MSFGLPQRAPDPEPIVTVQAESNGDLSVIVGALMTDMDDVLQTNASMLTLVQDSVANALKSAGRTSSRRINEILSYLGQSIYSTQATSQTELNSVTNTVDSSEDSDDSTSTQFNAIGSGIEIETENITESGVQSASIIGVRLPDTAIGDEEEASEDKATQDEEAANPSDDEQEEEDWYDEPLPPTIPMPPPGDVIHSTWLQRIGAMHDYVVSWGKTLISATDRSWTNDVTNVISAAVEIFSPDPRTAQSIAKITRRYLSDNVLGAYFATWQQAVEHKLCRGDSDVTYMFAVKLLLEYFASLHYSSSVGRGDGVGGGGGIGAHGHGVGCHIGVQSDQHSGADMATSWSASIVPAMEIVDMLIASELQLHPPSAEITVDMWARGLIGEDDAKAIVTSNGHHWESESALALARSERAMTEQVIEYARRTGQNEQWINDHLQQRGVIDPEVQAIQKELYDELPSIADHLHWLQRNVFDANYVAQYQLLDGFEDKFWPRFGPDLTAQGMRKQYAALHYAAHWIQPAPTQMQEFLYRIRPNPAAGAKGFTLDDFKNLLAEQDVSPLAREWFAATAYRVPALGYLRDMYQQGIINDDDLKNYHQDLGYTPGDSDRFVAVDRKTKARIRASQGHGWVPSAIGQAVAIGLMPIDRAKNILTAQGYNAQEIADCLERGQLDWQRPVLTRARTRALSAVLTQVKQAIQVGVFDRGDAIDALGTAGWPRTWAAGMVDLELTNAKVSKVKQAVSKLRSQYLSGAINTTQASGALRSLGIYPQVVRDYLSVWAMELTPKRKQLRLTDIISLLSQGLMTQADAFTRLVNLGYDQPTAQIYLAVAAQRTIKLRAQLIAAQQKAGRAQAKALAQTIKAAKQLAGQALKELKKREPLSTLKRWAKLGIINQGTFTARLRLYGYTPAEIQAYWTDACASKNAACDSSTNVSAPLGGP